MEEKQKIRKKFKRMRDELAPAQAEALSARICKQIITSRLFVSASVLYAYAPLGNEVDIYPVIREAWRRGKRVAFPKVFGDEMRYFEVGSLEELEEGTFGVMEPREEHPVDFRRAEGRTLVLTPGIAFDQNGNRMGFGKGYYDRHFSGAHDCVLLGVAYAFQVTDRLPVDVFDVPLPWVVTEEKLLSCNAGMNYDEAISFLKDTEKYGSRLGLDSIRSLMRELGDVQERIPIVHIAGTNGKGSVGAMLSAVLAESGYRVGRFNTPDVFSYEEEFLLNGVSIKRGRLAQLFAEVRTACARMTEKGQPHPTRFEVETAAAFLWFYQEDCDIAIVEAGMGGETDATNLIRKPLVSVLTSISKDHMKFLGDTLAEIAEVKAGIIKHGCPVVCAQQKPEVMEIIRRKCRQEGAQLFPSDEKPAIAPDCVQGEISFLWDMSVLDDGVTDSPYDGVTDSPDDGVTDSPDEGNGDNRITLGLRGSFQQDNAVCTLRVLEVLKKRYPQISRSSVLSGLRKVHWPGRFEQVASSPDVYLDGAHNEDAAARLRETLELYFPGRRVIFIMGVLADKEYEKMIRIMFREGESVFTITPPNLRALSAEELAMQLEKKNIHAIPCKNPHDAVSCALAKADSGDVILAFGSLSCLNGVREAIREGMGDGRKPESPVGTETI